MIILFFADILLGSVHISPGDVIDSVFGGVDGHISTIINNFRIPKALTAVLAGAALSVSGLQMQTIFRNPLAGPYVLGVSSGASLGVAMVIMGMSSFLSFELVRSLDTWATIVAAWIGAAVLLILILAVSIRVRDIMTILIIGIMFGAVSSAIISVLQYFSNESLLKSFVVWTLGSLGNVTGDQLSVLSLAVIAGLVIAFFLNKRLNALLLGETYAFSMGVNVRTTRMLVFVSTTLLAGSITAFCGPIAFIGIAVPHMARIIFRTTNHFALFFAAILIGSSFMLVSDIISHLPGNESILPVNSITSLFGIPVVVLILVRNRKKSVRV
ncbi:MAG: iron ABC transporter permease [Bacteroidota bacterium]